MPDTTHKIFSLPDEVLFNILVSCNLQDVWSTTSVCSELYALRTNPNFVASYIYSSTRGRSAQEVLDVALKYRNIKCCFRSQLFTLLSIHTWHDEFRCVLEESLKTNDVVLARKLLELGGSAILYTCHRGRYPIHFTKSKAALSLLLEIGGEQQVLQTTELGWTPFMLAMMNDDIEHVQMLLDHGAHVDIEKVDVRDMQGLTSLHYASMNGHVSATQMLIANGANVNVQDKNGLTPLNYAIKNGHHLAAILTLIEFGADVHVPDELRITPLHYAIMNGYVSIAYILLEHGANINALDCSLYTPLHYAIMTGQVSLASTLVQQCSDIGVKNKQMAIHHAVKFGYLSLVSTLIEHGTDINMRDCMGRTPLHYAVMKGQVSVVSLLIEHGADMNVRDRMGRTPLHISESLISLLMAKIT